jgi:hypothetical protein
MYHLCVLQEFGHPNLYKYPPVPQSFSVAVASLVKQAADSLSETIYVLLDVFIHFKMLTSRQRTSAVERNEKARKLNYNNYSGA